MLCKLTLALLLSSTVARAHEVVPTIADLSVAEGTAELSLRINLEAFLSGVDLHAVENTDEAEQAAEYERLHALSPQELAARAPELLEAWNALPVLSIDGTPIALESNSVDVPELVNPELPRLSEWVL